MKKLVVLTVLVASLLLFAVGCAKKADVMEDTTPPPAPEPLPAPDAGDAMEDEGDAMVEPVPSQTELLTGLACGDEEVSFTINNIGEEVWELSEQMFLLNEVPDDSPECAVTSLEVGQSTLCSLDSLMIPNRKNVVTFSGTDGTRGSESVDCFESEA